MIRYSAMSTATERKAGRNRTKSPPDPIIERLERLERKVDANIAVVVNAHAERGDMARWRRTAQLSYQDIADHITEETGTEVAGNQVALWEHCRTIPTAEQALSWVTYLHNENGMEVSEWEAMKF